MIYLDYAANTPVCDEVLTVFCKVSKQYIANPNSSHSLGVQAKQLIDNAVQNLAKLLSVKTEEIIFTSSASEANNLAIKGIARQYKRYGKHIITTYLEHSSINGAVGALVNEGFEVDYVNLTPDGLVDLAHLKTLLRKDTILVSVCLVDSEIGIIQNLNAVAALLGDLPCCRLHTDATQAVGKVPVDFLDFDLISFAPHKFYGLVGCGILIKKEKLLVEPLIHGGISTTPFRSGTPDAGQIAAAEKALSLALSSLDERLRQVTELNLYLRKAFSKFPFVTINSPENASPFILNISLPDMKTEALKTLLDEKGICLSTKSACCAPGTVSRPVFALTNDKKRALSTLRISLSHLTTKEELSEFLFHLEKLTTK